MTEVNTTLVWFDRAREALAQAKSIDEVLDVRDKAEALRVYTKQARQRQEMQNWIAEIKLRAERRAGELLREMERHRGAATPFQPETAPPPRLEADLGIDRTTAHRWQTIASLPEQDFEAHLAHTKAHGKE
jgi:hypothetical protein